MRRLHNPNVNTRTYWDTIYSDRDAYIKDVGDGRFNKAITYIKDGDRVLDIGCGVGTFCEMVKDKYPKCEVWGTDIATSTMIENDQRRPDIKWIPNQIDFMTRLPFDFDIVFSGETLEHIERPKKLFNEAYARLKDGGRLIITTPREQMIVSPEHLWSFDEDDIKALYDDEGFKDISFEYLPRLEHLSIIFAVGTK